MSQFLDDPRMTVNQAAKRLKVNASSVWRWILAGVRGRKLRSVLYAGRRYILVADLEAFLAAGQESPDPDARRESPTADRAAIAEAALGERGI